MPWRKESLFLRFMLKYNTFNYVDCGANKLSVSLSCSDDTLIMNFSYKHQLEDVDFVGQLVLLLWLLYIFVRFQALFPSIGFALNWLSWVINYSSWFDWNSKSGSIM